MPTLGGVCPALPVLLLMARPQPRASLGPSPRLLGLLLVGLGVLPSPSSAACGEPPTYPNMELVGPAKSVYLHLERISYQCRPGYHRRQEILTLAICGPSGQWSPVSTDACFKKLCHLQMDPVNGQVRLLNKSYEFGSQIQFVCNDGFRLSGEEILRCLLNGSQVHWSGEAPVCQKVLCGPPPPIPQGTHSGHQTSFAYGEAVTYTCGRGTGPDALSLVGAARLTCVGPDAWSSAPPECRLVRCPRPTVPRGRQTSGFGAKHSYRATVSFECDPGLFLHGSPTAVCEADSSWRPPLPRCLPSPPPSSRTPPGPPASTPRPGPRPPEAGGWTTALVAVNFAGVLALCACLYRFIQGRKQRGSEGLD